MLFNIFLFCKLKLKKKNNFFIFLFNKYIKNKIKMVDNPDDDDYQLAIDVKLNTMNLLELSNYYGGIENHIITLCTKYFALIYFDDNYFWGLRMGSLTVKEIINIMGYRRTKSFSKVDNLFNLLKEKKIIKKFDQIHMAYLLEEIDYEIK